MKKIAFALFSISLALPVQAQTTERLSEEALIAMVNAIPVCEEGETATSARYRSETDDTIEGTCEFSVLLALPAQTTERLSEEALIAMVNAIPACGEGESAISARYRSETDNTIEGTCEDDGFVLLPTFGLGRGGGFAAALAGLAIAAAAAGGGGGATPDTQ